MRGHMGSEVTEANCSEAGGPRNDPVGGLISAARANNSNSDPYARTPPLWTIIKCIHTAGCCRLGPTEAQKLTHLLTVGGEILLNGPCLNGCSKNAEDA